MTKRTVAGIVTAVALVGATSAMAADGKEVVSRVSLWFAKDGNVAKFEEGLKKHNQFHVKQNDPLAHVTYSIESGENTGGYLRVARQWHWDDFDTEAKMEDADSADSAVTLAPYLDADWTMFYSLMEEVSNYGAGPPPALAQLVYYEIKPGEVGNAIRALRKFKDAAAKTNWPVRWNFLMRESGGALPALLLVVPKTNWADFNPPEKDFGVMLEEALGKDDAESVREMWDQTIQSTTSEIIRFRADLSYIPAKK